MFSVASGRRARAGELLEAARVFEYAGEHAQAAALRLEIARTLRDRHDRIDVLREVRFEGPLPESGVAVVSLEDPEGRRWASVRMHLVASPLMVELGYSSKLNAEWAFLEMLFAEGRRAASEFLESKGENLGSRPSIDVNVLLEGV